MADLDGVRSLYANTAALYEQRVIPAFGPLAGNLAGWIASCASAHLAHVLYDPFELGASDPVDRSALATVTVIDVGTGTGILARALAQTMGRVIGLDISPAMLRVAEQESHSDGIRFVVADLHHLPFRHDAVQLAVSSFGLNASTPKEAFRSMIAALRPKQGMLAFQEWGVQDDCSKIVDEVLDKYMPNDIPGLDEPLRNYYDVRKPWYEHLQYIEDYYETLKQSGFDMVWVREAPFVTVHMQSIDTFLAYKLAWPLRRFGLAAMPESARTDYDAEVRARLQPYVNADGSFDWSPPLFRVFATTG